MKGVSCPECEFPIKFGARQLVGQRIVCPSCRTTLVIKNSDNGDNELTLVSVQQKKRMNIEVGCPDCEEPIWLGSSPHVGQPVTCTNCKTELEVISIDPIEVDIAMPISLKKNRYKRADRPVSKNRKFKD